MTTSDDQIRELYATLDRELTDAERRATEAEDNLRRAQEERDAAHQAVVEAQQRRDNLRRAFATVLGLEPEVPAPEPEQEPETAEAEPVEQPLQLVTPSKSNGAALAHLTQKDQLKVILGDRTMTLTDIRKELKERKLVIPNMATVLSKNKGTFESPTRGSWRVASAVQGQDTDDPDQRVVVLSRTEAQVEMITNRRLSVRHQ